MKVAIYARVSTEDQTTDNQVFPLKQYCERMGWQYDVFVETQSSRKTRPVQYDLYNKLLRKEYAGLVIYKFDRWARSTQELVGHMEALINKNVAVYSYTENIDLSSSMGRAMLTIISAFAQLERDLIRERTNAGLARAKAWGKIGGRHPVGCGCGILDKYGKRHDGPIKPIRNESKQVIGWGPKQTSPVLDDSKHTETEQSNQTGV